MDKRGGDTLEIEVNIMDGTGKLELTGKLGDVMQESAKIALTYVKSVTADGMPEEYFEKHDFHLHVPEGAVPKDGWHLRVSQWRQHFILL